MAWCALATVGLLALVACGGTPAAAYPPVPPSTPPVVRPPLPETRLERAVFELVNRHRTRHGLPPLGFDARIAREARRHSARMAAREAAIGHAGFDDRIAALRRVMRVRGSAENVAYNRGHRDPAARAVRDWLASRAHRRNIEGPYALTGVGVARSASGALYLTQLFVGR